MRLWNLPSRSLVMGLAISGLSLSATAAPTLYGIVNKEIRSISQDADANKVKKMNFTDVDGFETRLGAKGKHEGEGFSLDYNVELGLNTNRDARDSTTSNPERMRVRHAFVRLHESWGSVTLGKTWNPNALAMIKIDPFTGTGLQNFGLDFSAINTHTNDNNGSAKGIGYRTRFFQDQFTYVTPSYSGVRYHLTLDDGGFSANNSSSNDDSTYTSHMISWDADFGGIKNYLTITSSSQSFDKSTSTEEKFTQFGNKTTIGDHQISLAYGTSEDSNGENKRLFAAYAYMMGAHKLALSYGNLDQDNTSGTKLGSNNLVALGYWNQLTDMVTLRATAGQYSIKAETADTFNSGFAAAETENKATIIALGAFVKF